MELLIPPRPGRFHHVRTRREDMPVSFDVYTQRRAFAGRVVVADETRTRVLMLVLQAKANLTGSLHCPACQAQAEKA